MFKQLISFLVFLSMLCSLRAQESIRVEGSDLLAFMAEALPAQEGVEIDWALEGSVLARESMRKGTPDVVILAVPEGREGHVMGYKSFPFCYLISAVVVHADNPIPDINLEQLGEILRKDEKHMTWSTLGLGGLWGSRNLKVSCVDGTQGMALEMVKFMALKDADVKSGVQLFDSAQGVIDSTRSDPNMLGIIPFNIEDKGLKVLPVAGGASGEGEYAFGPTAENVNFGDYPLRLKFVVCVKDEKNVKNLKFIKELYSDVSAEVLVGQGVLPVLKRDRQRVILGLDNW